jgi:quinol monooxygenase YgiN
MGDEISWVFEVTLNPGVVDDVTALLREMVDATRSNEPETLSYHTFITEDGARVHFYERYKDSAAALFHVGRFGEHFASRILALSSVTRFEIYGSPSEELKRTTDGFGAAYFTEVAGFAR